MILLSDWNILVKEIKKEEKKNELWYKEKINLKMFESIKTYKTADFSFSATSVTRKITFGLFFRVSGKQV